MSNLFAVVGSWGFGDVEKGLTVYRYDQQTGELKDKIHSDGWLSAGHQCYDPQKKILYVVDEVDNRRNHAGGGGFVRAYQVHSDGKLEFINETCTLMGKPCYVTLAPTGDYLLVSCHASRGFVTKVVHDAQGNWTSAVLYDDAGVTLLRVNADGSVGQVCDIAVHTGLTKNKKQVHAHPHSIVGNREGSVYYACDKGLDRIYSYRLDRENGKLIPLMTTEMEYGTAPRYSVFHPILPVMYENNEDGSKIYAMRYDAKTGALDPVSVVDMAKTDDPEAKVAPSDITVHPNGKVLYCSLRGVASIAVFDIEPEGSIVLKKKIDTVAPVRGFCLSPDGKFLLAACERDKTVKVYSVGDGGILTDTGRTYEAASAANVQIIEV